MTSLSFGYVVETNIRDYRFGSQAGKLRPAVWVRRADDGWYLVEGLTTLTHFADGRPREPVAFHCREYPKVSHLWGGRLVRVPPHALIRVLGHLCPADLDVLRRVHPTELAGL